MSLIKSNFRVNSVQNVEVKVTDKVGTIFSGGRQFRANSKGEVGLSPKDFRALIGTSRPNRKAAFLIPEFDEYVIELKIGEQEESIVIESGIGKTLVKEEWRDGIVGNLFYPATGTQFKTIIHLSGSVQLLQDSS